MIEQTEALVSIDVNGGHVMFGHGNSQEKAILDVNLAAAKQVHQMLTSSCNFSCIYTFGGFLFFMNECCAGFLPSFK